MKPSISTLKKAITSLKANLDGLREFVKFVEPHVVKSIDRTMTSKSRDLVPLLLLLNHQFPSDFPLEAEKIARLKQICGPNVRFVEKENEGTISTAMELAPALNEAFEDAMEAVEATMDRQKRLYQSSLVSLISTAEVFFAQLLHCHLSGQTTPPGCGEKSFSYEDLVTLGSISDARDLIIESKIEDVLRGPLKNWFEYAKKNLALSMGYINDKIDLLSELSLRRNLFVHNGGVVNKLYLSKVPESQHGSAKIGEQLHVDNKYLNNALDEIELAFLLTGFEYWKKLDANDDKRGSLLHIYSYDALLEKRYPISEGLSFFLRQDKGQSDEMLTFGELNFWLSRKKMGKLQSVAQEIAESDYSAKLLRFQVGHAALQQDEAKFFELAQKAKRSKELSTEEFTTFPIFDDWRKDERFVALLPKKRAKRAANKQPKKE